MNKYLWFDIYFSDTEASQACFHLVHDDDESDDNDDDSSAQCLIITVRSAKVLQSWSTVKRRVESRARIKPGPGYRPALKLIMLPLRRHIFVCFLSKWGFFGPSSVTRGRTHVVLGWNMSGAPTSTYPENLASGGQLPAELRGRVSLFLYVCPSR